MPKLIDYPRTSYTGAWELSEIVDDTGGKCSIETAARKLNRKVSGSFKAIIGSGVKFGLMTSKRELLTTTTLFRRIKHAYDKAEELQFHREAFLTPPLFTQICRKFRSRELPVQMLDVMLIREFGVEEINAQNVAKAFVDGCRMCGLIDENNVIADIDAINNRAPRRTLASISPELQTYTASPKPRVPEVSVESNNQHNTSASNPLELFGQPSERFVQSVLVTPEQTENTTDAIASLFGLGKAEDEHGETAADSGDTMKSATSIEWGSNATSQTVNQPEVEPIPQQRKQPEYALEAPRIANTIYQMQMRGPGVNTALEITEEADITIAIALLEKIRRQLRASG